MADPERVHRVRSRPPTPPPPPPHTHTFESSYIFFNVWLIFKKISGKVNRTWKSEPLPHLFCNIYPPFQNPGSASDSLMTGATLCMPLSFRVRRALLLVLLVLFAGATGAYNTNQYENMSVQYTAIFHSTEKKKIYILKN